MEALRQENAALRAQIVWLKQKLFGGAKSEKLDQAQLRFQLEELEKLAAKTQARVETITYERSKGAKEPRQVPADAFAHLPVVETIEIVPEPVKQDPELYEKIGEERTFEVDVIEPKLVRREIVGPSTGISSIAIGRRYWPLLRLVRCRAVTLRRACSRGSRSANTSTTCRSIGWSKCRSAGVRRSAAAR